MPSLKQPPRSHVHTHKCSHRHTQLLFKWKRSAPWVKAGLELLTDPGLAAILHFLHCKQCEDHLEAKMRTHTHGSARLPLLLCCFLAAAAESSDWARRLSTSARAAFITVSSSSCCCTRSSRDDRRSCTSDVLAAEILSSARETEIKMTFPTYNADAQYRSLVRYIFFGQQYHCQDHNCFN